MIESPRAKALVVALLGAALLAVGSPSRADDANPSDEIKALAEAVASATTEHDAWNDAVKLAGYRDKAATFAVEAAASPDATPLGRVALGSVLLKIGERGRAAQTLLAVANSDASSDLKIAAISLVAGAADDDQAEVGVKKVLDESLDPRVRAAAAKTLWSITKDVDAKARLKSLMKSDDFDSRVEGAIAMAEIRDFSAEVKILLTQIRDEPTPRGRLARALLEKNDVEQMFHAVKPAPASSEPPIATSAPSSASGSSAGLEGILDDTLAKLRALYVDPNTLDEKKLYEGAARGLVEAIGDQHTVYQSSDEHEDWVDALQKQYGGIGAYVGIDADGFFSITRPMFGGPAWKAQLRPGDRIIHIKNYSGEQMEFDTGGQDQSQIIKHLRGVPDSDVTITVVRKGWREPREMTLKRGLIKVPTVWATMLEGHVGYITIDSFAQNTAEEFVAEANGLHEQGATSLIIDLRNNGGGYLAVAEKMGDYLLPMGKLVVETKGRPGVYRNETYVSHGIGSEWSRNVPLAVLVNENSASASEILSGSLQRNGRAKIVGERTFGKGSVQNIFPIFREPFSEPFTDLNHNGVWDSAERFEDTNQNGVWDAGEPLDDRDENGRWTAAEPFSDKNGNGEFDAPSVKITIAKYYVGRTPGAYEFNPNRKLMTVQGRRVWLGGVEPDVPVASDEFFEGWRTEEISKLEERKVFEDYLDANFEANKETFLRLAVADSKPTDYPKFDELYASLGATKLSKEDVWYWLHYRARAYASNALGKQLVGDWIIDSQIQAAIKTLRDIGPGDGELRTNPAYARVMSKEFPVPPTYGSEALKTARPVIVK